MYSTYRLKAEELSEDFVAALKKTYHDREIEIIVQEVQDETEYLLSAFPLGGYVKMVGENPTEDVEEGDRFRSFALSFA